jgi:hypothetical protein
MTVPRPKQEKGLVLPFRRREKPRAPDGGAPVEGLEKYAESEHPDDYRQRMINNVLAFTFCILLVAAGIWLADKIAEMRKNQDCVLSGRRNCANVITPPASPL